MAYTAVTDFGSEDILLNPSGSMVSVVTGKLTADSYPGQAVVFISATKTWTLAINTTASHKLMKFGIVGYKKRVNQTTNALKLITDAWDISEAEDKRAPIILSGFCIAYLTDQGGTVNAGTELVVGATAGNLTIQSLAATGATSGTAYRSSTNATAAITIVDDDTRTIIALGAYAGQMWGGYN